MCLKQRNPGFPTLISHNKTYVGSLVEMAVIETLGRKVKTVRWHQGINLHLELCNVGHSNTVCSNTAKLYYFNLE